MSRSARAVEHARWESLRRECLRTWDAARRLARDHPSPLADAAVAHLLGATQTADAMWRATAGKAQPGAGGEPAPGR